MSGPKTADPKDGPRCHPRAGSRHRGEALAAAPKIDAGATVGKARTERRKLIVGLLFESVNRRRQRDKSGSPSKPSPSASARSSKLRTERKIATSQLTKETGLDPSHVHLERRRFNDIGIEKFARLVHALSISADQVLAQMGLVSPTRHYLNREKTERKPEGLLRLLIRHYDALDRLVAIADSDPR